jgi:predicted HAD superfamily Cof-like phosphohydrolase
MTNISHCVQQVMDMHTKFGLDYHGAPRHLSMSEEQFRSVCLHEELREFDDAISKASVDAGFQRVMAANMQKQVAMTATASKRDFELDLIKPADWAAPDLHDLVGERS